MPGEMGLVVEARCDRHTSSVLTVEQTTTGNVESTADEVAVRGDAEAFGERADQMGDTDADDVRDSSQTRCGDRISIEDVPRALRYPTDSRRLSHLTSTGQMVGKPLDNH